MEACLQYIERGPRQRPVAVCVCHRLPKTTWTQLRAGHWLREYVRADQGEVSAESEAARFRLVEAPEILRRHYFLRFQKL